MAGESRNTRGGSRVAAVPVVAAVLADDLALPLFHRLAAALARCGPSSRAPDRVTGRPESAEGWLVTAVSLRAATAAESISKRPEAPARSRTLERMDPEWSDPELLRAIFDETRDRAQAADRHHHRLPRAALHPGRPRARTPGAGGGDPGPHQGLAPPGDRGGRRRPDLRRAVRGAGADGSTAGGAGVQLPLRLPGGAGERGPRDPAARARPPTATWTACSTSCPGGRSSTRG